jgi:hypothetical protein
MSKSSGIARNEETDAEKEEVKQPDAIRYFEIALMNDPWLWEAWRGMCDFGE